MSSRAATLGFLGALSVVPVGACASGGPPRPSQVPAKDARRDTDPGAAARTHPPSPATPPSASQATAEPANPVRRAYVALVRTSIVPADPRAIGAVALAHAAAVTGTAAVPGALPADWGRDAERDGAWLEVAVSRAPSPWPVIDAMARAARTAHVGLVTPRIRAGIAARLGGHPRSEPGFNVYRGPDGRFVLFDVVPGASAATSGLRNGDVLERLGGEAVEPLLSPIFPSLTGVEAGEHVALGIERQGRHETVDLALRSAFVPPAESRLLRGGLGYVRIRWFARSDEPASDTPGLVRAALASFVAAGARGVIVDLRSSPGGVGFEDVASALVEGDPLVLLQVPGQVPSPVGREGNRVWSGRPIAFLVNGETMSAGEDVVLAVRELAPSTVVVGRTTAGALTEFGPTPLGAGHGLIVPTHAVLGPRSRIAPPLHAIVPEVLVDGATPAELVGGRDPELEAARMALAARAANTLGPPEPRNARRR